MSVSEATTNWDALSQPFPSLSEYDTKAPAADIEHDTVEDGEYTLALVHMTEPFANNFPGKNEKNPKPIVFLYFRVLEADDPSDVGKVLRKKVKYTGHPKGGAYRFLAAAYGGKIDPDVEPVFTKMKDMQIKAFLQTKTDTDDSGKAFTWQDWQAIRPVRERLPVVPF